MRSLGLGLTASVYWMHNTSYIFIRTLYNMLICTCFVTTKYFFFYKSYEQQSRNLGSSRNLQSMYLHWLKVDVNQRTIDMCASVTVATRGYHWLNVFTKDNTIIPVWLEISCPGNWLFCVKNLKTFKLISPYLDRIKAHLHNNSGPIYGVAIPPIKLRNSATEVD